MGKKKRQNDHNSDQSSTDSNDDKSADGGALSGKLCQHIARAIDYNKVRKTIKLNGLQTDKCSECDKLSSKITISLSDPADNVVDFEEDIDRSLWLCLRCGTQLCGRFRSQHALQHHNVSVTILNVKQNMYYNYDT